MIAHEGLESHYEELFSSVFDCVDLSQIHSISLGAMRFPKGMFKQIRNLYPEEPLFAAGLKTEGSMVSYGESFEQATMSTLAELLQRHVPAEKLFVC